MNTKTRIEEVTKAHKHQHSIVETLEAEKAPEETITKAKIVKLKLKDELEYLYKLNDWHLILRMLEY